MAVPTLRERIAGVIFGTAIGDALGFQVEFSSLNMIQTRFGPDGVTGFDSPSPHHYSDDTQMMRATFEGLLRARTWDDLEAAAEEVAEEYVAWWKSPDNNRAPGNACMAGCEALAAGRSWKISGRKDAKGCGTAMRSMAYGVWLHWSEKDSAHWAAVHALMTHQSATAQAAAAAMAAGVAAAMQDSEPSDVAEAMIEAAAGWDNETSDMLVVASELKRDPLTMVEALDEWRGWRGDEAVAAALYVFLTHPDDFKAGVLAGATSPGDSDSIACMVGALSGARLGIDAIPTEWITGIEKANELAALVERIDMARHRERDEWKSKYQSAVGIEPEEKT